MPAELDRNATRWIGRPQVGRFYGDFLCMASIRENEIFSGIRRRISEKSFKSIAWLQSWLAHTARNRLEILADSGGK